MRATVLVQIDGMPVIELTAKTLRELRPIDGKRSEYFDANLPGFSVRVSPSGKKTFCVLYRSGRRLRRYTIGRTPPLTLAQARKAARTALAEATMGGDPASGKTKDRRAPSFSEMAAEYLERHAKPNKRSWREDARRIHKTLLPAFGPSAASSITRADIRTLLDAIVLRPAPSEANQTHALLRTMYNWAIARDLVEDNPCRSLPRPAKLKRRHHVLTEDDIRRFWTALEEESAVMRAVMKIRLLTAQRGGELLTMRWENVELETCWWTIPAERSKNGLPHRVPLTKPVIRILRELRAVDSPWVFPSPKTDGPLSSTQKAVERIRRRAGIDFRGHDLRRTAASFMTSMGTPRLVVAKILNHVETDITAVYDRHSYDREKREALDAWAERLERIVSQGASSLALFTGGKLGRRLRRAILGSASGR